MSEQNEIYLIFSSLFGYPFNHVTTEKSVIVDTLNKDENARVFRLSALPEVQKASVQITEKKSIK
jgi:hypothetical protein